MELLPANVKKSNSSQPMPINSFQLPQAWTMTITTLINLFMLAWHLYEIILCLRRTSQLDIPIPIYVLFMLTCAFHALWLMLHSMKKILFCVIVSFVMGIILLSCLILLFVHSCQINRHQQNCNFFTKLILHNGLTLYMMWAFTMAIMDLEVNLGGEQNKLDERSHAKLGIILLAVMFFVIICTDYMLAHRYTELTITPYLFFIWLMSGIIKNNAYDSINVTDFTLMILIISIFLSVLKVLFAANHAWKMSLHNKIQKYSLHKYSVSNAKDNIVKRHTCTTLL